MAYTIAFFGSKPYDEASFNEKNKEYGFELRYYKGHLNKHNVILTQGVDAVCIFVNDTADTEVIRLMADNGVKLLALRCAGYNNVDLKAAADCGITVVRVPAYSPYAVAEYTVALMLSLNRKIPRATWRTRDGNFSLHGLLGFATTSIPTIISPVNIKWYIPAWMSYITIRISSPCTAR